MLTDLLPEDDQHYIACEGFGGFDFVKGEAAQAADQRKSYRQTGYGLSGSSCCVQTNAWSFQPR